MIITRTEGGESWKSSWFFFGFFLVLSFPVWGNSRGRRVTGRPVNGAGAQVGGKTGISGPRSAELLAVSGARRAGWLELSLEGMRLVRQRGRREPVLRRAVGFEAKGNRRLFSFLFFSFFPFLERQEAGGAREREKWEKTGLGDGRQQAQVRTEGAPSGQNETCRALRAAVSSRSEERAAMPQNGWAAWQARMEDAGSGQECQANGSWGGPARYFSPVSWNIPLR